MSLLAYFFMPKKDDKIEENKKKNLGGRPLKFKSVKLLEKEIEKYFQSCWDFKRNMFGGRITDDTQIGYNKKTKKKSWKRGKFIKIQIKPYTVSGLAVYLETSRDILVDYGNRKRFSNTIKRAKDIIYSYTEESLFTTKPTGPIFSLKNNYDWKDKKEIDTTLRFNISKILDGLEE